MTPSNTKSSKKKEDDGINDLIEIESTIVNMNYVDAIFIVSCTYHENKPSYNIYVVYANERLMLKTTKSNYKKVIEILKDKNGFYKNRKRVTFKDKYNTHTYELLAGFVRNDKIIIEATDNIAFMSNNNVKYLSYMVTV